MFKKYEINQGLIAIFIVCAIIVCFYAAYQLIDYRASVRNSEIKNNQ